MVVLSLLHWECSRCKKIKYPLLSKEQAFIKMFKLKIPIPITLHIHAMFPQGRNTNGKFNLSLYKICHLKMRLRFQYCIIEKYFLNILKFKGICRKKSMLLQDSY